MDTDVQQMVLVKEEAHEEQSAGVDQKDSEHLHLMRKQEGLWTSLEEEQLCLKEETDPVSFPFTVVFIKGEDDEENPLVSELHHQEQMENGDVQTTSSADHMTSETSAGAQTNRNPDLKSYEQTSSSSEAEVNGEEEVNLDSALSDSGPEIGDGDSDWNENRSSESGVKIINKSFSCPECGKQFFHKSSLQKHMRVTGHSAMRSSGCLVNKKCVRVKKHVDSSTKAQKEPKSFSCDDCGKMFSHKTGLNTHMSVHTGQKPFTCQHCGQQFRQKAYLNSHMRVHTKQKPFTCEFCGRRFSHKASLNSHIRVHTGQKPFACELCGQKFSQNAHLNCHKRVHTGQKPLVCELCGKSFSHRTSLNRHIRVHTGQKPFACELCEQRFSQKTTLNGHMRVHTGQKPFACELCGQRFSHKSTLNSHMRLHTGQKPFTCQLCGQRFSQKAHLTSHTRIHTGQKPFACELCGRRFSQKSTLNSHIKIHTGHKEQI